ncbi:MAG: MarR family winged helix-turn-helix transcriptional regulator [Eubacteriales bacterium]
MSAYPNKKEQQATERYHSADINDKLIINLRDMGQTIRQLYEGKGSQKRILIILLEVGSITQRELTTRLGVQPGSASEVIAKLENAGLILRTVSPDDRRTANIRLTPDGEHLAQIALEDRLKRHREMFSCLSDDEKQTLLSLMERVCGDWDVRYRKKQEEKPNVEVC